jgi:hypothetical protein
VSNEYVLNCIIDPIKGQIKVNGTIIIPALKDSAFFILNRGLRWTKTVRRTASGYHDIAGTKIDNIEVPKFYNGDLWIFDVEDSLQDEFVIEIEYSGRIHPPSKGSEIPTMGYIKRDFVELACYSAWYPVPFNMDTNISFELTLRSPEDWTWEANGRLQKVENSNESSVWRWKQPRPVNDITIVGLPKRNAHLDENSIFWGPKEMIGSQRVLESDVLEMKKELEKWLGPRITDESIRFAVTPRELGGAYARAGLVIVGGGYSTEIKIRRPVLQAMCHEICHDWFCKASVKTYDNWLDEALAEYCSIVITDKHLNEGFLDWRIGLTKEKLDQQKDLPSIRNLTRDQNESYAAYYFRGFLLLNDIAEKYGREKFNEMVGEFAQVCVKQRTVTTEMFLDIMEKKLGEKSRKIVDFWLDFEGPGVPST